MIFHSWGFFRRDYFCGWYFKCQSGSQTIAVIPAIHRTGGKETCSIQLLTDGASWNVSFPYSEFRKNESGVDIAGNHFGREGITLNLHSPELTATGSLSFGPLAAIKYDIMGPFKYVPFMQCRHSIFSMKHSVNGQLGINGITCEFQNGIGYIEGDRGYSFPKEYSWTQCCFPDGSLMLSVADIPFCGLHFTGVIGAVHWQGKEYRIGTYLGARAIKIQDGEVIVKQGRRQLTVRRLEKKGHPLAAPIGGKMSRTIHETAACKVYFHYQESGRTLFEFESPYAAFEYEYPR